MKLYRQPVGTNICGQACLTMLTGAEYRDVVANYFDSYEGRTNGKRLMQALTLAGIEFKPLTRVKGLDWPGLQDIPTAIVKVAGPGIEHWIVWHNGKIYDPAAGVFRKPPMWMDINQVEPKTYIQITKNPYLEPKKK